MRTRVKVTGFRGGGCDTGACDLRDQNKDKYDHLYCCYICRTSCCSEVYRRDRRCDIVTRPRGGGVGGRNQLKIQDGSRAHQWEVRRDTGADEGKAGRGMHIHRERNTSPGWPEVLRRVASRQSGSMKTAHKRQKKGERIQVGRKERDDMQRTWCPRRIKRGGAGAGAWRSGGEVSAVVARACTSG